MKTKKILEQIVRHLESNRGAGHTTAMIRGAQNVDRAIVLTDTEESARSIKIIAPALNTVAMTHPHALTALKCPLILDNSALSLLCESALFEIVRLERKIAQLENQ